MDNKKESELESIKLSTQALEGISKTSHSAQLQELSMAMQKLSSVVISTYYSDAMQAAINIGNRIAETIKSIDFKPLIQGLYEVIIPIKYINLLQQLKWPIFLIDDDNLRQSILNACTDEKDAEKAKDIIFNYCTKDFLTTIENDWNNCPVICEERKEVLSEAILMHNNAHYYASTSMLMCQIYGVASDIVCLAKKNGLELDDEEKGIIADYFKIALEDIDKEKGKLLQMTAMTESGQLFWEAMADYLQKEILSSSDSKKRWETQPLRNKICHGDQLNFGTKEHSLKAILTIDMLVQLAYEINHIIELTNNTVEKDEE